MVMAHSRRSSWSSTVLFLVLFGLAEYVQYTHGYAYCQFYKPNDPRAYIKLCPSVCCTLTRNTRDNTTCCEPVTVQSTVTTTYTIFGYSWWMILLCAICLTITFCLLLQSYKHARASKHFGSTVEPQSAFTISKSATDTNAACTYTVGDDTVVFEQHPPNYPAGTPPASPPPYISVEVAPKKVSD